MFGNNISVIYMLLINCCIQFFNENYKNCQIKPKIKNIFVFYPSSNLFVFFCYSYCILQLFLKDIMQI